MPSDANFFDCSAACVNRTLGYPFNRSYTSGMELPIAGIDYPCSFGEFQTWFQSDADYLDRLHWPTGFVCPDCG